MSLQSRLYTAFLLDTASVVQEPMLTFSDSDDEDETATLMAELAKIKQERAEEKARQVSTALHPHAFICHLPSRVDIIALKGLSTPHFITVQSIPPHLDRRVHSRPTMPIPIRSPSESS